MESKSSKQLIVGELYSRRDLARKFRITDASRNNGIFKPRQFKSVWLFVTEKKPSWQTQYRDRLRAADLYMDGQTSGRTDKLIMNHRSQGLELLLFYRKWKQQYRDFAFKYQGPFRYVSHSKNGPKHFHLSRLSVKQKWWQTHLTPVHRPRKLLSGSGRHAGRPNYRVIKSPLDLSRKLMKERFRKSLSKKEVMDLMNERTQAHQDLVAKLYMFYAEAGLECRDWPFDLLAIKSKTYLLHEVKTVRPNSLRDERRRIREAIGQLAYYEYFDVIPKIPPGSRVEKFVVLQREPAAEHVSFLKSKGIGAIWIDSHREIQGDESSLHTIRNLVRASSD